eukprot:gene26886-59575_t
MAQPLNGWEHGDSEPDSNEEEMLGDMIDEMGQEADLARRLEHMMRHGGGGGNADFAELAAGWAAASSAAHGRCRDATVGRGVRDARAAAASKFRVGDSVRCRDRTDTGAGTDWHHGVVEQAVGGLKVRAPNRGSSKAGNGSDVAALRRHCRPWVEGQGWVEEIPSDGDASPSTPFDAREAPPAKAGAPTKRPPGSDP